LLPIRLSCTLARPINYESQHPMNNDNISSSKNNRKEKRRQSVPLGLFLSGYTNSGEVLQDKNRQPIVVLHNTANRRPRFLRQGPSDHTRQSSQSGYGSSFCSSVTSGSFGSAGTPSSFSSSLRMSRWESIPHTKSGTRNSSNHALDYSLKIPARHIDEIPLRKPTRTRTNEWKKITTSNNSPAKTRPTKSPLRSNSKISKKNRNATAAAAATISPGVTRRMRALNRGSGSHHSTAEGSMNSTSEFKSQLSNTTPA